MCKHRVSSFLVRGLVPLIATVSIGMVPTAASAAQQQPPKRFLLEIYKRYMGKDAGGIDWIGRDKASLYFDAALTELIVRAQNGSEGELGRLEFDPFVNGQDFEFGNIAVAVSPEEGNRVKATASFDNSGRRQKVF